MTYTSISREERRRLARMPPIEDAT
jgi:hypothetical protein